MSGETDGGPTVRTMDFAVLGTARSGTSALSRMINEDPACFCGTEFFAGAWKADYAKIAMPDAFLGDEYRATNDRNTKLTRSTLQAKLAAGEVTAYGNKHPSYFLVMDQLHRQLPQLRSVFIYRDIGEVSLSWDKRAANEKDSWHAGRTGLFGLLEWVISLSRLAETRGRVRIVDYAALFFTDPALARRVLFFVSGRNPSAETLKRIAESAFRGGGAPKPAETAHDALLAEAGNAGLRALLHGHGFVPAKQVAAGVGDFAAANMGRVFGYVTERLAREGTAAERAFALQWAGNMARQFDNPRSRTYGAIAPLAKALVERLAGEADGEKAEHALSAFRRRIARVAAAREKAAAEA